MRQPFAGRRTVLSWWFSWLAAALLSAAALVFGGSAGVVVAREQPAQQDLADTIAAAPQLSTLARAVQVAGLVETLKGPGPLTVLAPNNAAFDKLPPGTLDGLLRNPAQLRQILSYHLAPEAVTSAEIVQVPNVRMVEGETIRVTVSGGAVHVNDATVVQPDVEASNGAMHVIDRVLLPASQIGALPTTGEADQPMPALIAIGLLLVVMGSMLRAVAARRLRVNPMPPRPDIASGQGVKRQLERR